MENLYLNLTQAYLEMARSVFNAYTHSKNNISIDSAKEMLFSMTSTTIIYSYMALESFLNYQLYEIWEQAKNTHEFFKNNLNLKNSGAKPDYDNFYNDYGPLTEFEDLKNRLGDINNYEKAIEYWEKILEIDPGHKASLSKIERAQEEISNY